MYTDNQRGVLFTIISANNKNSNIFQKNKALQARCNCCRFVDPFFSAVSDYLKRASLRLSVKFHASVSVEAAIAIPIFMFCFLEILSLLNYISVYSGVLYAMKSAAEPVCVYGYAYDLLHEDTEEIQVGETIVTSLIFSEVYMDTQIRKQCAGLLYEDTIKGGVEGITLLGSYINIKDSTVSVVARYIMEPLINFAGTELPVICRYYGRLWTGYNLAKEEVNEEYVYITETGSVYHLTEACTHLKLSITSVSQSDLDEKRNNSGGRYRACFLCCDDDEGKNVYYITGSGDKYHSEISCSGLKRTVYRVEKEDVEEWTICSRCGQNAED